MNGNPLQRYFRTPAIYFSLPSGGKYYQPGVVNIPPNGELPVYPMTTRDEMSIRVPDGLYNGSSVVDVIKNCIPNILDPWRLNSIDLEAVIVALRAASVDGELEIESDCPQCGESAKYGVDLLRMLADKVDVDYDTPLQLGDLRIVFRPLTYQEINTNSLKQFNIQRVLAQLEGVEDPEKQREMANQGLKQLNELSTSVLCQCIRAIMTPETTVVDPQHIREYVENCDSKTGKILLDYNSKLKERNETKPLQMTCIHCKHQYKQSLILNFTDFFE